MGMGDSQCYIFLLTFHGTKKGFQKIHFYLISISKKVYVRKIKKLELFVQKRGHVI